MIGTGIVGASAYKQGTDRALCIQNLAKVQNAMRAYCHFRELIPGQAVSDLKGKIISAGFFNAPPECPGGGTYQFLEGTTPEIGTLFMSCSIGDHRPKSTAGW